MKFISALIGKIAKKKLALSHEDDVDGIVSASLYLIKYPNAQLVLAQPREIQRKYSWYNLFTWDYVADLPCPKKVYLYVDHHKSNIPRGVVNFHNANAPSAASLAIKALNLEDNEIASTLVEIANDADTGRYELKETILLNDAVKGSNYNGKIYLAKKLAELGLKALDLPIVREWIKINQKRRERTLKIADNLPISRVLIVEFPKDLDLSYRGLCLELQKRGASDLCALIVKKGRLWRVYLGASRESPYDCSIIATKLGGGGHKFAAGAHVRSKESFYRIIKVYLKQQKIPVFVVENEEVIREKEV